MADNTKNYALPYPESDDGVVVHEDVENLAQRIDSVMPREIESSVEASLGDIPDRVESHHRKLGQVEGAPDDEFRVRDQTGAIAFGVRPNGDTSIGRTVLRETGPGVRYMDASGQVAFEITENGQTIIYDHVTDVRESNVEVLHVFVAAGQSNMSGYATPVEGPQSYRIKQYGANRRVIEDAPLQLDALGNVPGVSPALFFAEAYLATQPNNVGVLLVPGSRNWTRFAGSPEEPVTGYTWVKDGATTYENNLYNRSVDQTHEALQAARDEGYIPIIKGVLWHQGEANQGTDPAVYADYLDDLVYNYRSDLEAPYLPVVVGQPVPEWVNSSNRQAIDEVIRETPKRTRNTGYARGMRDAHIGDNLHYSQTGVTYLGHNYLDGYYQALGNIHQEQ